MQTLATTLIFFGGLLCFANWMSILQSIVTKKFHSAIPLLGAALLGCGMLLRPTTREWAWLAIPLDYGTLALLFALPRLLQGAQATSRFNLLKEYSGSNGNKKATLCFFRNEVFTIKLQIKRPVGEIGITKLGRIGKWHEENSYLKLEANNEQAVFELSKSGDSELLRQIEGFTSLENEKDCSLAKINFVLNQVAKK